MINLNNGVIRQRGLTIIKFWLGIVTFKKPENDALNLVILLTRFKKN